MVEALSPRITDNEKKCELDELIREVEAL